MKVKIIITIILLTFVAAGVGYLIVEQESRSGDSEESKETVVWSSGAQHRVLAYYFHGDKRCRTCLAIEEYTREAIEEGFPEQLESGVLELRIVNVDESEHEHFIEDYRLTTKSVVLADYRNGVEERWKNLNMVWEYVNDRETFLDYVKRETEIYLEGSTDE